MSAIRLHVLLIEASKKASMHIETQNFHFKASECCHCFDVGMPWLRSKAPIQQSITVAPNSAKMCKQ